MPSTQRNAEVVDLLTRRRGGEASLPALEIVRISAVTDSDVTVDLTPLGLPPALARSLVEISTLLVGDEVAVAFAGEDGARPVIMGRIHDPAAPARDIEVNGRRITMNASSELVLRCSDATIRIGRDGQVSVRGDQVATHARGVNCIQGGSVEIN
jgi:hypothetical protein